MQVFAVHILQLVLRLHCVTGFS